jgi:hypothetical protein
MKRYEIIEAMTKKELLTTMVAAADVKLHHVLTDIDVFWSGWNFMKEELLKKEGEE